MHPTISTHLSEIRSEPNTEMLSRLGWQVGMRHGRYCVVWKDAQEVLVEWTGETWRRVTGR